MREVPARPTHLPNSLIGLGPSRLQGIQQAALEVPGPLLRPDPEGARLKPRIRQLAVDVQLQLLVRLVADAPRARALVTGQPVGLVLCQPALARDAVHDLQARRIA